MQQSEILQILKSNCKAVSQLTDEILENVISNSSLETFESGEIILEIGDVANTVLLLLTGAAKGSYVSNKGKEKIVDTISAGAFIGEEALISNSAALASIIATEVCTALKIPSEIFLKTIASDKTALKVITDANAEDITTYGVDLDDKIVDTTKDDPFGFKLQAATPQKILVINCGSSSLKYTFFDTEDETNIAEGQVDRIGTGNHMGLSYEKGDFELEKDIEPGDHKAAFDAMLAELISTDHGIISDPSEITAVGHRVVHGGDTFSESTLITDNVIKSIEEVSSLAPLHNPVNLVGVKESIRVFPAANQVAVFDTAFHQTIEPHAFLYGLPYEYYTEKKIRRYGFHGTSHYYVSLKAAEYFNRPYNNLKTIVCHIGNGGSLCAVKNGKSIDTTMGLTPAEGIIMGTRAGSIDPAALLHLMDNEGMSSSDINQLINKKSGLLGLSGISNDMRDIEAEVNKGNNRAVITHKTFCYSVKKYIGSYNAVLGGADALVFTGGIGLYSSFTRVEICKGLEALGMKIDPAKSAALNGSKKVVDIATEDSPIKILIIPTNEELMIARETLSVLK